MLNRTTTTITLAAIWALFTAGPVNAQTCPHLQPAELLGKGLEVQVARPEGREMCFTIAKSGGIAARRITVLSVRPVLNAAVDDIEVQVTKERSLIRGSSTHRVADLTAPDLLGGGQIFLNVDDDRHLTVRVRPRHVRDYRLVVIAHEIDVAELLSAVTVDVFAHLALDAVMKELGVIGPSPQSLDVRMLKIGLKAISGAAKGHSGEEIVAGIAIQMAIREIMDGADVPREVAIVAATLVAHVWRETSKGALRRVEWTLPEDVRDTSQPRLAAN